jgi:hypothetical protein
MSQAILYHWIEEVTQKLPNLKKWQVIGLALFSYGIVKARRCQASLVAEELPEIGKADSLTRRFQRWLSNVRIDVPISCHWWIKWVWSQYDGQRPILLVDETKLGARIGVMMVSLAFEKRAIPLMWRCYIANSKADYPAEGQVKLIEGLIQRVIAALPEGCCPLLEVDRGIGNSSNLMRAMENLGIDYLFRVKKGSVFTSRRGKQQKLRQLIKIGEEWTGSGWIFTKERKTKAIVHLIWEVGQKEPWCLVTNDKTIQGHAYAQRVWQEESFRDLKSGGWQWQCSLITKPDRAERLILVLALAYAWMLTQGTFVLHAKRAIQLQVTKGRNQTYSIFRLGLRFFKRMLSHDLSQIYVGLFLAPLDYKPLC